MKPHHFSSLLRETFSKKSPQIKNLRTNKQLDDADALALACYCWDYLDSPLRLVQIRDKVIVRIREIVLWWQKYLWLKVQSRISLEAIKNFYT